MERIKNIQSYLIDCVGYGKDEIAHKNEQQLMELVDDTHALNAWTNNTENFGKSSKLPPKLSEYDIDKIHEKLTDISEYDNDKIH